MRIVTRRGEVLCGLRKRNNYIVGSVYERI